jgi:hypothetical protein
MKGRLRAFRDQVLTAAMWAFLGFQHDSDDGL